jgi:hypothetical protein
MSEIGEGLQERKALPSSITRNYFIVRIDMAEKEEDEGLDEAGLIEQEVENDMPLEVAMTSEDCKVVSKGDEVIMSLDNFMRPKTAFKIGNTAYYMYTESDVLGIW